MVGKRKSRKPRLHSTQGKFACDLCDVGYNKRNSLICHVRRSHPQISARAKHLKLFTCEYCDKGFQVRRSLLRHWRLKHGSKEKPKVVPLAAPQFKCNECEAVYNRKDNLIFHMRRYHPLLVGEEKSVTRGKRSYQRYQYYCSCCMFETSALAMLYEHYSLVHSLRIESEHLVFDSLSSFLGWKEEEENATFSKFIKHQTNRKNKDGSERCTYHCHRSGVGRIKNVDRKRGIRAQGTKKIGKICTSKMLVKIQEDTKQVVVEYVKTHAGHEFDLSHVPLPEASKTDIANKLLSGASYEEILDESRANLSEQGVQRRSDVLTIKDIQNIEQTFHIKMSKPKKEPLISNINEWAAKARGKEVLFFKMTGETSEEVPDLSEDDYCLIIMNEQQIEILQKFVGGVICIECTELKNTTDDSYKLITLVVLDELYQAFPCAFMVTNKVDELLLSVFFSWLKEVIGDVHTKIFLSDFDEVYYTSWLNVMPPPEYQFYSSWNVECHLRDHVYSQVGSQDKREELMDKLKQCIEEPDENVFGVRLENIMLTGGKLDFGADFYEYFSTNFSSNYQQWGRCFRKNCGILNLDLFLDRIHTTMLYLYLRGKKNTTIENCVTGLLNFVRSKYFNRTTAIMNTKQARKLGEIAKCHAMAVDVDKSSIVASETEKRWYISTPSGRQTYTVAQHDISCNQCTVRCNECNICMHSFVCTCTQGSIKWGICIHCHVIASLVIENGKETPDDNYYEIVFMDEDGTETDQKIPVETTIGDSKPDVEDEFLVAKEQYAAGVFAAIIQYVNTPEQLTVAKGITDSLVTQLQPAESEVKPPTDEAVVS